MKKLFSSIRTKFLVIIISFVVISVLSISVIVVDKENDNSLNTYYDTSKELMQLVGQSVSVFYDEIDKNINMMAENPTVKAADNSVTSYVNSPGLDMMTPSRNGGIEQEIYEIFEHYANTHAGTVFVYVGLENGGYIQWPETGIGANYVPKETGWYQISENAEGEIRRTDPYFSEFIEGEVIISNTRVLKDKNGKKIGVVGIDVLQTTISDMLAEMRIKETGYFMIVHNSGFIMADGKNSENNFKKINETDIEGLDKVLESDEIKFSTQIDNSAYQAYSAKIDGTDWRIVSFMSEAEIQETSRQMISDIVLATTVILVILIVCVIIAATKMANPIVNVAVCLDYISKGDFRKEINKKYDKQTGEIGRIVNGIKSVKKFLTGLISNIKEKSDVMQIEVSDIKDNIEFLNKELVEVSSVTQYLAAGMEETAASSIEIASASSRTKNAISEIIQKSKESLEVSKEIYQRATKTKYEFNETQKETQSSYEKTKDELERAILAAKAIEQINVLAETIMGITDQTTLLSLNASIEAARAGENGRGFAVVAGEIGKLAEQSKESVLKIQQITSEVTQKVENLSECSQNLLGVMSNSINSDYTTMLNVAEQYSKDAQYIGNLIEEFNKIAKESMESIGGVLAMIEQIADATEDGANGTTEIAGKISQVSVKSDDIRKSIEKVNELMCLLEKYANEVEI